MYSLLLWLDKDIIKQLRSYCIHYETGLVSIRFMDWAQFACLIGNLRAQTMKMGWAVQGLRVSLLLLRPSIFFTPDFQNKKSTFKIISLVII